MMHDAVAVALISAIASVIVGNVPIALALINRPKHNSAEDEKDAELKRLRDENTRLKSLEKGRLPSSNKKPNPKDGGKN